MRSRKIVAIAALLIIAMAASVIAQPTVSEKKEIAIFSLGYYGWNIPLETLGTIDVDIQRVFIDLGRFTIFGMQQRFAAADVDQFITVLKQIKETNFVLPEKYQFGEAFLTEADFNKLVGAFIIAVPVVTSFNSEFVSNKEWRTDIKTNISFIDVADGTLLGIANVETSGSSRETQYKSIQGAIDGIPMQLQYEIRKVPAFTLNTRVLGSVGGDIKIELGTNMGIKKGDEYSVITGSDFEGYKDEREVGLLLIKDVGPEVSTAIVLFSKTPVVKDTQLKEIPRQGADLAVYAHTYSVVDGAFASDTSFLVGARAEMTRGFFNVRPYAAVQMILDSDMWLPLNAIIGAEYSMFMRRLEVGARAGLAGSTNAIVRLIEDAASESDDPWFTHYGISAGAYASFLVTRDMKIFVEGQFDYMLGIVSGLGGPFDNYGGYQLGVGVTFKM
ncbi:MAG: hypothetical protein E4H20_05100 [Spirochaetales bacterium]|nr:MAG: hypothetical protein E4H20_05100 [Spirochaetales bacterium]